MSQYGANYYQEQQSQNTYSPRSNQTQTHYPMVETVYDQKYEPASGRPLGHDAPQSQYTTEGANASYYSGESAADPNDPDGEKGLGSTVVGGVAGGYMGDKMGGGWSTAAGAGFGTIGMNLLSHKMYVSLLELDAPCLLHKLTVILGNPNLSLFNKSLPRLSRSSISPPLELMEAWVYLVVAKPFYLIVLHAAGGRRRGLLGL